MSILGDVGDFISGNSTWLKPVGNALIGAVGATSQNNARNSGLDALQRITQQQWEQQQAQAQADAEYEAQRGNWAAGQRAASAAAAAANARARQAAATQTAQNQMAARKKGDAQQIKALEEIMKYYQPYKDTALRLLPQMEGSYTQGNQALQQLAQKFVTPEALDLKPQIATNQRIPMSALLGVG